MAINPLRYDPTRTTTLRKKFMADLFNRFNKLKGNVLRLVEDEDAFGLRKDAFNPFTFNSLHEYSSTQVDVKDAFVLMRLRAVQSLLDPADVIEVEDNPHITVRYGLHTTQANAVRKIVAGKGSIPITFGGLALFRSAEQDVLYVEVDSDAIRDLNKDLAALPHTQTHAGFMPHMTVAYLQPGTGDKYVRLDAGLQDHHIVSSVLTFSDKDRKQTDLTLNNCGTGHGGFKPGNTCARGGGGGGLASALTSDEIAAVQAWGLSAWGRIKQGQKGQGNPLSMSFDSAIQKLPSAKSRTYRGIALDAELSETYEVGSNYTFQTSESFSSDKDWAEGWAVEHPKISMRLGHTASVMVLPSSSSVRDLQPVLDKSGIGARQREHVTLPGLTVVVTARQMENGVDYIYFNGSEKGTTPTINTRWKFRTSAQKLLAFQRWIQEQIDNDILEEAAVAGLDAAADKGRAAWEAYIRDAFLKGAGRAFDDAMSRGLSKVPVRDFFNGTREQFLRQAFAQPETVEKVQLLAARTFNDLKGVTQSMSTKMQRTLADGLAQGMNPRDIARQLNKDVDGIGIVRARTIARTEIIRAHAEGQLDAFVAMGVTEIGVAVEWSTSGFKVCPLCSAMEGVVLTVEEARGMIPRHPNCKCSFIPANVGESTKGQRRSRPSLIAAIKKSVRAERVKQTTWKEAKERTKWAGVDASISKKRPKSII